MSTLLTKPSEEQKPSLEESVFGGKHWVMQGACWEDYESWDAHFSELGYGRVSYCDGVLEIMTLTKRHELVRRILSRLIEDYSFSEDISPDTAGSATIRKQSKDAGREPDDSFWFDREGPPEDDDPPDLITEIVVTSEAISKQSFYARFGIPEMWIWESGKITIYLLKAGWERIQKIKIEPDFSRPGYEIGRTMLQFEDVCRGGRQIQRRDWLIAFLSTLATALS